jgi:hypothetical protein
LTRPARTLFARPPVVVIDDERQQTSRDGRDGNRIASREWAGGERRIRAVAPVSEEAIIIMDFESTSATALKQMTRRELLRVIDRLQAGNSELQEAALIWIDLYEGALERERRARALSQPVDVRVSKQETAA